MLDRLSPHSAAVLFLIAAASLGAAYVAQYGFGLQPCVLCLYQRIPYAVVIALALLSYVLKGKAEQGAFYLCALAFLIGAGIAFYQAGGEWGIYSLAASCGGSGPEPQTLEELQAQLLGSTHVPCDKAAFVFLGLSMAGWNGLFSLLWAIVTLKLIKRRRRA